MEEFRRQDFFTYNDQEHNLYYGFSSPRQLQELRKWGDTFRFDGTHQASGTFRIGRMTPGAKQELAAKIKVLDYIAGKRSENPEAVLMSLTASDRSSV
ncbi:hypothetical protein BX616_004035 [Lobosporangium transversale]|nr:hypothetical protein BX616_004035 [Lobosporangium transversale]